MNVLGDSTIGTLGAWLRGLSGRQQAISDNIANIDTPGYRRKDVPFEAELRRAIGQGDVALTTTDPRHIAVGGRAENQVGLSAAQLLTSSRLDENDVSIDEEMVTLAETQLRYQAASSALSKKFQTNRDVLRSV
jgi:flagellar basal-body rod protein FlgB